LLTPVKEKYNWDIEIISGEKEAFFSYSGAVSQFPAGDYGLIDLGGASTEIVCGGIAQQAVSFNVGAVRAAALNWGRDAIRREFLRAHLPSLPDFPLIGIGGTFTAAAALKLNLKEYDPASVQGLVLTREYILGLNNILEKMPLSARGAFSPVLAHRGEIICHGLIIAETIMELLGRNEIIVSSAGILEGIILCM
jgi:exopolyphosphatase/guanosine-5'-triphosphate,3'-diphosphate pyrophosphatase